jgi:hypothetical protein
MTESKEKQQRIESIIEHWTESCILKQYLREGDIRNLASQIIDEFYHVQLCCNHKVMHIKEGIRLAFKDVDSEGNECEVQGDYCRDCAEKYKKELGAWEIKNG